MIISEYKGQRVAIDLINGCIHPFLLIKRVLPSGCKAATLAEHRIRKQGIEITKNG